MELRTKILNDLSLTLETLQRPSQWMGEQATTLRSMTRILERNLPEIMTDMSLTGEVLAKLDPILAYTQPFSPLQSLRNTLSAEYQRMTVRNLMHRYLKAKGGLS